MIGKAILVVLASNSGNLLDNLRGADVVYHQVMPAAECEKIAEQLRRRKAQGAVCVPMEIDHGYPGGRADLGFTSNKEERSK